MLQDNIKKGQMTFFYIDRKIPCLKKIIWVYVTVYYLLSRLSIGFKYW